MYLTPRFRAIFRSSFVTLHASSVNLWNRFGVVPEQRIYNRLVMEELSEVINELLFSESDSRETLSEVADLIVTLMGLSESIGVSFTDVLIELLSVEKFHNHRRQPGFAFKKILTFVMSSTFLTKQQRVEMLAEIYVDLLLVSHHHIGSLDLLEKMMLAVAKKNDDKTDETHYLAANGKITRK